MTARTLITRSLQLIGVVASGETPTADESNDGLLTLNDLLQQLQFQGLSIFTITRATKAIVASQATYTIGAAGDFNRLWTNRVDGAAILYTTPDPDVEVPIRVLTEREWQNTAAKGQTSTVPNAVYLNPTYPLATLHVYPVATDTTVTLVLYIPEPVTTLATLDTAISLPPGYEAMLRYNLAMWLSPEYERPIDPVVAKMASDTMADVKRANFRPRLLRVDSAITGGQGATYNIYTDDVN